MKNSLPQSQDFYIANQKVRIRPIQPSDMKLEAEFIEGLSEETKHARFLASVSKLSDHQLEKFCNVTFDDKSAAFVATINDNGKEREIGVVRYASNTDDGAGEMAITVADEWQNKGLGTKLLNTLTEFAGSHGLKQLYSIDLADNYEMRDLAKSTGMSIETDSEDPHQLIYSIAV